jgi:hypothetical protein
MTPSMVGDFGDLAFTEWCRQIAACAAGVSIACRRSSHFSLLAQRKVTQRKRLSSWQQVVG